MRATTDYIETWLSGLSERTKENYLREFDKWLEFIKLTPQQQIEKRLRDTASTNLNERSFFEQQFRAFKEHLEKEGKLSALSIKTQLRTVASFFSRNGLPLALKRGDWESTLTTEVIHRFKLEKEDIKKMYAHANLRDRALLLVLAQSGFSEIDVSMLKIEDLKGLNEMPQSEHYFIEKKREKTNVIQATCISYEALHDIKALLEETKETIGYIFTSQTRETNKPIEVRRINNAMKNLATKALGKEKAKDFKTKALRSFYNSALLRSGIRQEIKDVMMGHKRLGARGHYSYDDVTIKENYSRAFEHLSINGIQTREDIAKYKQETNNIIAELKRDMAQQKETHEKEQLEMLSRIEDLKTELINKILEVKQQNFNLSPEKEKEVKEQLKKTLNQQ